MTNLKTKIDHSDVGKLKTVPVDWKKIGDVVSKEVVEKTMCSKLNMKVNNLENKILIHLL